MRIFTRWLAATALAAGAFAGPLAVGASASPGFPAGRASCVAGISDYLAHFDVNTGLPVHGQVGQSVSGDATSAPGVVGVFNRTLATSHGPVSSCVP